MGVQEKELTNEFMKGLVVIKEVITKGENRRINIFLLEKNGELVYFIQTKRLVNFSKREITITENFFTIETFSALAVIMFGSFAENDDVLNFLAKRKILTCKYNAITYSNPKYINNL